MNSFASIYVPRMSTAWTEDAIKGFMADKRIGNVSHVDFTPINKKPGFGENVDSVVKSAFIHFSNPILGPDNKYHYKSNYYLINSFWVTIENDQSYKLNLPIGGYWICLKNKNPVQRTMMNIHQVVENGRYLENLITEQAEEIKKLKETVDGLHHTVYQLLGGLYCQHSQGGILNLHLKTIGLGSGDGRTSDDDTHPSGIWPTTRQGDENSQRIKKLEHFIEHHILPEAITRFCDYKDNDVSSQQDDNLYNRKRCVICDIDRIEYDVEEYERFLKDEEEEEERKQGRRDIIEERW